MLQDENNEAKEDDSDVDILWQIYNTEETGNEKVMISNSFGLWAFLSKDNM